MTGAQPSLTTIVDDHDQRGKDTRVTFSMPVT